MVTDTGKAGATVVAGAENISKLVKEFAQQVHDQYSDQCGGLTVDKAEEAIRHANGDLIEGDGGILDWLGGIQNDIFGGVMGAICGGPLGALAGLGLGRLDQGHPPEHHRPGKAAAQGSL